MTFPEAVDEAMPPDNELVGGTVVSVNPLQVNVRGGIIPPGVLGSYVPSVGDPVQLLRQDGTWLVLGSSVSGADATNSIAAFNAAATADTTAAAVYTNMDSASLTFVKRLAGSRVRVDATASMYTTAVNTKPRIGLDFIDTTTAAVYRFNLMEMLINAASQHTMIGGGTLFSGIPAGTYTVQMIWLRVSGAGTLTLDSNDWISLIVAEVA